MDPTKAPPTSGGATSPSENAAAESPGAQTMWVVLMLRGVDRQTGSHVPDVVWSEHPTRLSGTRREAEKDALALAAPEQGIVVMPESSWKPKVAEPPREPRIADFDPWAAV